LVQHRASRQRPPRLHQPSWGTTCRGDSNSATDRPATNTEAYYLAMVPCPPARLHFSTDPAPQDAAGLPIHLLCCGRPSHRATLAEGRRGEAPAGSTQSHISWPGHCQRIVIAVLTGRGLHMSVRYPLRSSRHLALLSLWCIIVSVMDHQRDPYIRHKCIFTGGQYVVY
jgi:hypothetical protein